MDSNMNYNDIVKDIVSHPRETFIDALFIGYHESFDDLNNVRICFYEEAVNKHGLNDQVLVRRRKGDHQAGARRLATDCHLIHSFITGTSSQTEVAKEIFSKGFAALSQSSAATSTSPTQSPTAVRSSSLSRLPTSPTAADHTQVTTPHAPQLLIDSIAAMKEDILGFKGDQRADFDALQKEIDSLTSQFSNICSSNELLQKNLAKYMKRTTNLESEIVILKNENGRLDRIVTEITAAVSSQAEEAKKANNATVRSFAGVEIDVDKICSSIDQEASRIKRLQDKYGEQKAMYCNMQSQINNISEPRKQDTTALKSELKRVREQTKCLKDDFKLCQSMYGTLDGDIKHMKKKIDKITKRNSKLKATLTEDGSLVTHQPSVSQDVRTETPPNIQEPAVLSESNVLVSTNNVSGNTSAEQSTHKKDNQDKKRHKLDSRSVESFYIGNLETNVSAEDIGTYLVRRKVGIICVYVIPSQRENSNCARIIVEKGNKERILTDRFFPGKDVYARIWYPRRK